MTSVALRSLRTTTESRGAILSILLDEAVQRPWAEDEIAREIGDPLATTDALASLYGAGLIHRLERFVFATRPAVRGEQLAL